MTKPIIVIGGGGHGKVVASALIEAGADVLGCVDPALEVGSGWLGRLCCLGNDQAVLDRPTTEIELANGVGSLPGNDVRKAVFRRFVEAGYQFSRVIHPAAVIAVVAVLGEGVQVMANATVQSGVVIGQNTIVNTGAIIDHDCRIGDDVHIAPGAVLSGDVDIANGCHVGTGASIIQGICVGQSAVVGAGAVVTRSVSEAATVYPARSVTKG